MALKYVNPKKATRYEAFKMQEKVGKKIEKEAKTKAEKKQKGIKALLGTFRGQRVKGQRRAIARRAAGTSRLLGALGIDGKSRGRGRPSGTYKYGLPIQEFKKQQAKKRALYQVYQQEQYRDLARRGLTPEDVQKIQYQRALEEGRLPSQGQQRKIQVPVMNQEFEETPEGVMAVADDELEFRRFAAKKAISPNTQRMLVRLRRTQLKSQRDDVENQRRLRERRMIASAGSILETPFVFNKYQMDITGIPENNILKAPNYFKANPENNILKPRGANVLTPIEGNNIMKRRPDSIRII